MLYKGNDVYYLDAMSSNSLPAVGGTFGSTGSNLRGPSALTANVWVHLAATYDGATLRLYVNGTQVASKAQTGSLLTSTNPLQIGGDSLYGQFFQGQIDEVRVYKVALTATQIQTDMNTPIGGAAPTPDMTVTKTHSGHFTPGQTGATYTLTVRNGGAGRQQRHGDPDGHAAGRRLTATAMSRHWLDVHAGDPTVHAQRCAGGGRQLSGDHADGERGEQRAGERHQHGNREWWRQTQHSNNTANDVTAIGSPPGPGGGVLVQ